MRATRKGAGRSAGSGRVGAISSLADAHREPRRCFQHVRVRLGYLVSTSAGMGALMLKCSGGCSCRPVKSTFLRTALPFPRLEASAVADVKARRDWGLPLSDNVTMTAHTIFIATLTESAAASPCYLNVHHIQAADLAPRRHNSSRVRIDSLAMLPHGGDTPTVPC